MIASEISDSIVRAASRGDADALNSLVELSRSRVHAMVAARLPLGQSRHDLVEDLSQDALLALSAGISGLDTRTASGLRGYLSSIVRNKVLQHLRVSLKAPRGLATAGLPGVGGSALSSGILLLESIRGEEPSPSSNAARLDLFQALMLELAELKPSHREALTLAFFDQLTSSQIAQALDLTRPNAAMLVLRAIEALRKRWRLRRRPGLEGVGTP